MNKKILDILGWQGQATLRTNLQTEQREMELAALTPTDKESIEAAFGARRYGAVLLEEPRFCRVWPFQRCQVVRQKRLEMEAALNIDELLALKAVLRVTHELKSFKQRNVRQEGVNRLFDNLIGFTVYKVG